jgi:L-lactate utilization protein LutC
LDNSELISQFIIAAQNAGAKVEEIAYAPDALCNSLAKNISGLKKIIMSEPHFIPESFFKSFKENNEILFHPDTEQLRSAEAGITDAFAGVARTGSVCVPVNSYLSGYISLLPRKHIVVLESKNIVPRPRDIFEKFISEKTVEQDGWIFISGPSATADMGELVRGVHGPDNLHIILLD